MKNLSRMHIHPDRMGAIRDSEVKQLFLNAKPQTTNFFFIWILFTLFIAPPFCNLSFYSGPFFHLFSSHRI